MELRWVRMGAKSISTLEGFLRMELAKVQNGVVDIIVKKRRT